MLLQKKITVVLAILAILLLIETADGFKTASLQHPMKTGEFVQDSRFLTNPGQVYGSCYEMQTHGTKFQAHCTIALETKKPISSPDHQKFCHFILRFDHVDGKTLEYKTSSITTIHENKAVLSLESRDYTKLFVLHFSDCRAVHVDTQIEPKTAYVAAPFDDLIDVIATDKGSFCSGDQPCITTVDTEGKVVETTKHWARDVPSLIAIVHSPTLGRLVVDERIKHGTQPIARIYAIRGYDDYDDRVEHLWEKRLHKADHTVHYDRLIVSTTNDLLSACAALDAGLSCVQFDLDGEKKFETSLPIHRYLSVRSMNLHNLSGGGFLLVVAECSENNEKKCSEAKDSFFVRKVDATGRKFEEFESMKPQGVDPKLLHFFENREDGMCLSHAMQQNENAVLDVVCFRDNEFM